MKFGSNLFMNIHDGKWQVPLDSSSQELYQFQTPQGLHQPLCVMSNLKNEEFVCQYVFRQSVRQHLFADDSVLLWGKELLIHARNLEGLTRTVWIVLDDLADANVQLYFHQTNVIYVCVKSRSMAEITLGHGLRRSTTLGRSCLPILTTDQRVPKGRKMMVMVNVDMTLWKN